MLIKKSKQIFFPLSGLGILMKASNAAAAAAIKPAINTQSQHNLVCFYDSTAVQAKGLAQFTLNELESALQYCTHLIYGYVGLDAKTFEVISLNQNLDIAQQHFEAVTALKQKFPQLKILLCLGGDHDHDGDTEKYISLLEAGRVKQANFIESARRIVKTHNFDGLDLALQLPRNKPRKPHTAVGSAWKNIKKIFSGDFVVDAKANEHRQQITNLVKELKTALEPEHLMLSLTVLPNVNSSWYYDAAALMPHLDFVNLAAFDFVTPARNPEEADYTAPLYEIAVGERLPHYNVDFQVEFWLKQRVPPNKINLGIASYGQAWKMTKASGDSGLPIVSNTAGAAAAMVRSHELGHFNWQQICDRLTNQEHLSGIFAPLHFEGDPTKRYGVYAFRPADEHGDYGLWISYEDPETAANKANYARSKHLGGVALFDLNNDDFHGLCQRREKYAMLHAIKTQLD